jgi:hypothetical protein
MSRTAPAALLALGLLLTAGCAGDASPDAAEERGSRAPADVTAAPEPATGPAAVAASPGDRPGRRVAATAAPPSPTGNMLGPARVAADGHLLRGAHLGSAWSIEATGAEDGRVMSECQRASMADIGAMRTRIRDFSGPTARAGQSVSRFADGKSAWRAEQVLVAWRDECGDDLRARGAALGAVRHRAWLSVVEVEGVDRPRRTLRRALRAVERSFAT